MLLKKPPAPHTPALKDVITNWPIVRGIIANMSRKQVAKKARKDHYPAPYAIIDLWENFGGDPRNVLLLAGGLMLAAALATLMVRTVKAGENAVA